MMPIYEYKCPECGQIHEKFNKMANHKNGPNCCGKPTKQYYGSYYVVGDFEPYLDENLGPKPVYVKSKQHRKELMKQNGLDEKFGKGWI